MPTAPPLPPWVQAIESKPAPMPLLVVQAFVNTWEAETGIDELADQQATVRWLAATGLVDPEADGPGAETLDPAAVRAVRERIRAMLVQNGGRPVGGAELSAFRLQGEGGGGVSLVASLDGDGSVSLHARGAHAWVARLLLIVRDAQHDGTWSRLKACRNDDCRWAFYDRSHARRGAWCDMAVCGNRIKNRNLRTRRAAGPGSASRASC